jgi:hypothetical protein
MHGDPDLAMILVAGVLITLGVPIIRALIRRMERTPVAAPSEIAAMNARLERIEQGLEAIAIEVERSAESDRFIAKLLSERDAVALPVAPRDR